jgi:hypothetical protein
MLIRIGLTVLAVGYAFLFALSATQAQTVVIVINPDTGEQGQALCDRDPPKGAPKGWLKQHCKPRDPTQDAAHYFDVFFEIEIR